MKVLIDTSIWSLILRRKHPLDDPISNALRELIQELRAWLIGPIRQELLSGIQNSTHFEKVRDNLSAFSDFDIIRADHERAAAFFNLCQFHGIQGSNTDFLICAVSERYQAPIFTTDHDFDYYVKFLPIQLFKPGLTL